MSNPEHKPSVDELLTQMETEDTFNAKIVGRGLQEIYRSGKYASVFIPMGSPTGDRVIEAVHIAASYPGVNVGLLEFIPEASGDREEMLQRQLREQLAAFEGWGDLSTDIVAEAPSILREEGLHVFGAFQLGELEDGYRTTEILFPKAFTKITGTYGLAATLAAAFVMSAQRN